MGRLVQSEWTKLLTTRLWIGLLIAGCLLGGGFATLLTAFAGDPDSGIAPVGSEEYERMAFGVAANATVLTLVLGIVGMTQEYRHRTATPTFLASPHRGRVVGAKVIAYAGAAVPFAAVVCAVTALVVVVYAGARGAAPSLDAGNLGVLARAGLAMVVFAVIGVGLGALMRNQVGAVVGALVYLYVVEPIIAGIPATSDAYRWLPGGALQAMTGTAGDGPELLDAWQGGILLLGYGLLAAVLGTVLAVRRDVV